MNRDLPIQVKEQKQTKNKNKFHRVEDAKKNLKELISYQIELMRKKKSRQEIKRQRQRCLTQKAEHVTSKLWQVGVVSYL